MEPKQNPRENSSRVLVKRTLANFSNQTVRHSQLWSKIRKVFLGLDDHSLSRCRRLSNRMNCDYSMKLIASCE